MDTIRKFDLMEKMVHELEDLKNSQEAIIRKLGKLEVDNMELADARLEKELPDMHGRIANNLDAIASILEYFAGATDKFSTKNNVVGLKEQEIINNL